VTNMKRALLILAVLLSLLTAALSACATETSGYTGSDITVRIVVTQGFGRELMLDETLKLPAGTDAMNAVRQIADVETAYGGGFVNAINGISSDNVKKDWLIYANGISMNSGALDYELQQGDTLHFDFRDWGFRIFIPAIIGSFPEPFLHGFEGKVNPTVIVYEGALAETAADLESRLKNLGVTDVDIQHIDNLMDDEKKHSNLIILGTSNCNLISEVNAVWNRMGFFIRFEGNDIEVYDSKGEVTARYGPGCGVIEATQSPWNPRGIGVCDNVVWVVSGIDEAGVMEAAEILLDWNTELQHSYALIVSDGDIIKVPQ